MARRFVMSLAVASCVVVGFLAVFSVDRPHAVSVAAYVVLSISLVSLGLLGRWGALPVFTVIYGAACVAWQALWWTDDPMGWASASLVQRLRRR